MRNHEFIRLSAQTSSVIDGILSELSKNGEAANFIKPYDPIKKQMKSSEYYFPHIAINEHLHMSFAKNELGFFDVPRWVF